jgi:short-subunit dehydrogenase
MPEPQRAQGPLPHVVVTGASAGVGRVVAREFAREGARLSLIARSEAGLAAAAEECRSLGAEAAIFPADVGDEMQLDAAAQAAESRFGPVDIWVNNAMATVVSPVTQMSAAEFRRVTDVTYLGAVYGTLAALRSMQPRNRGVIIQVGSALAYRAIPLQSAYCAAKHALLGFTESLRTELMKEKSAVHLTLVHLPAVNTPQFNWALNRMPRRPQPVPPVFQPEMVARVIVRAARQRRREWFVGFPTFKAVWADKLVPQVADWYLARTGFDSQQSEEPEDAQRPCNLWNAMPDEYYTAHGRFDRIASAGSAWQLVNQHRWLALGIVLLVTVGLALLLA